MAYFADTPLREISPDWALKLVSEAADHFESVVAYKHFLPRILEVLTPAIGVEDIYPEHLFEVIKAHGYSGWPEDERDAIGAYVVAMAEALAAVSDLRRREWCEAAKLLTPEA